MKKKDQQQARRILDEDAVRRMLAILCRNTAAIKAVAGLLQREHFDAFSVPYGLAWTAALVYFYQHNIAPSLEQMLACVQEEVAEFGATAEQEEELLDFVEWLYDADNFPGEDVAASAALADYSVGLCKRFIQEQTVLRLRETLVENGTVPENLSARIEKAQEQLDIYQSAGLVHGQPVFGDDWQNEAGVVPASTHVVPLDLLLEGGHLPGEVNVYMGPYGSNKTTLAVLLTARAAQQAATQTLLGECPAGKTSKAILVSTEMSLREFRLRILTVLARIPRTRLMDVQLDVNKLSNAKRPGATSETRYEWKLKDLIEDYDEGRPFYSEQERFNAAIKLVNDFIWFIDFTGAEVEKQNWGAGGISELSARIRSLFAFKLTLAPSLVVIDHASALVERMMDTGTHEENERRHLLRKIPDQARKLIAERHQVPVWIMHQLSGAANAKGPFARLSHADAAECKAFAESSDQAIVSTKVTEDDRQLCVWRLTTHRRLGAVSEVLVHLKGDFGLLEPDSGESFDIDQAKMPGMGFNFLD